MTTSLVTKPIGAVGLFGLFFLGMVLVPLGCTNLDENPPSAITPANFYRNQGEVLSSLAGIYAQLRGTLDDYYNVSEISTDEMIVPTRGSDWYDGDRKSTRLNSSHVRTSYAVFCLKKKKTISPRAD